MIKDTLKQIATLSTNIDKEQTIMTIFKKRKWSQWKHIMFVEDFRAGIKTYEIMCREDFDTGLKEYKRIYIKDCVHNLANKLNLSTNIDKE